MTDCARRQGFIRTPTRWFTSKQHIIQVVHFHADNTETWYHGVVIEEQKVVSAFRDGGVSPALTWAHRSAAHTILDTITPALGFHTDATRSLAQRELLIDRTDRVAQCRNYAPDPLLPEAGQDLLSQELHPAEPLTDDILLPPGTVVRNNIKGSQGWRFGEWQWLCATFKYDQVNKIRWESELRQQVAAQECPDYPTLFRLPTEEQFEALGIDLSNTLILAQALDVTTNQSQLFLGRPRLSGRSGSPWYWLYDLLGATPDGGRVGLPRAPLVPMPIAPREVADAPMRLRPAPGSPGKRSSEQG